MIHNLDDNLQEHFDFIANGNTYRFTHPTSEEWSDFTKVADDNEKALEFLGKFIKPVNDNSPSFAETYKTLRISQLKNFKKMLEDEFGKMA